MKIEGVPEGYNIIRIGEPVYGEQFIDGRGEIKTATGFFVPVCAIVRKLPEPLKLREGGWYERRDGTVVGPAKKQNHEWFPFTCGDSAYMDDGRYASSGFCDVDLIREVDPPKPTIDPGDGWRLLGDDEERKDGDEFLSTNGVWLKSYPKSNRADHCPYRRRIKQTYRPYKDAAEFYPDRGRWIMSKREDSHGERLKVTVYNDSHVSFNSEVGESYRRLLNEFVFENGDPCGVRVV